MNLELNSHQGHNLYALEEICSLPLLLDSPFYRNYPAMKLGQLQQVAYFGKKLFVLASDILQKGNNNNVRKNSWVITAPPYIQLPAAANLLARKVHDLLLQQGFAIDLVELRLRPQQDPIRNQEEFNSYNDYSKNNLQQRITERERVQQLLVTDGLVPRFKDRSVIIINDINVTGTQQYFIQQSLYQLQVHACHWLYIFNVEQSLAKQHPELEHQINNSQISDLQSYAKVLADRQTQHTARCISRLFNENITDFSSLIASLDMETRAKIYRLAQQEGRYGSSLFAKKMTLLATESQTTPTT
jgi:hypothetical protein